MKALPKRLDPEQLYSSSLCTGFQDAVTALNGLFDKLITKQLQSKSSLLSSHVQVIK